jgi:hypothetical protein
MRERVEAEKPKKLVDATATRLTAAAERSGAACAAVSPRGFKL